MKRTAILLLCACGRHEDSWHTGTYLYYAPNGPWPDPLHAFTAEASQDLADLVGAADLVEQAARKPGDGPLCSQITAYCTLCATVTADTPPQVSVSESPMDCTFPRSLDGYYLSDLVVHDFEATGTWAPGLVGTGARNATIGAASGSPSYDDSFAITAWTARRGDWSATLDYAGFGGATWAVVAQQAKGIVSGTATRGDGATCRISGPSIVFTDCPAS